MITPNREPIRIMLVDNHTLVRTGFRMLIDSQPGLKVVGEAGSIAGALAVAAQEQPDIILLELNLNGSQDTEIIPQLLCAAQKARLLLVTADRDPQIQQQAVRSGAMGVVLKEQPAEVLTKAIQKVHAGEAWLDRTMIANVLAKMSRARAWGRETRSRADCRAQPARTRGRYAHWSGTQKQADRRKPLH